MNINNLSCLFLGYLSIGLIFKLLVELTSRCNRPLMFFEGRRYTYKEVCCQASRYGRLFRHFENRGVRQGL